jgi:hypothetical protein
MTPPGTLSRVNAPPPTGFTAYPAHVPRARRRRARTAVSLAAAGACLVTALAAGLRVQAELTRPPTAAERASAAAAAVAGRWQTWPAGTIFPAAIGYTTSLLTRETARRVGIGTGTGCAGALAGAVARAAERAGCRAAIRATYLDQLQGVVYTAGVLAFPTPRQAAAFARAAGADRLPAGLRALAFPGTASAGFGDAARQAASHRGRGPYVVLAVAGYADGRPAAGPARPSVFAPTQQLAGAILAPLARPVSVNCASPQWAC